MMKTIIAFIVGAIAGVVGLTIYKLLKKLVTPTPFSDFEGLDHYNQGKEWDKWDSASCVDYFNFEASLEDTKPHFIKESEK